MPMKTFEEKLLGDSTQVWTFYAAPTTHQSLSRAKIRLLEAWRLLL
jgi:hypothetical protein